MVQFTLGVTGVVSTELNMELMTEIVNEILVHAWLPAHFLYMEKLKIVSGHLRFAIQIITMSPQEQQWLIQYIGDFQMS